MKRFFALFCAILAAVCLLTACKFTTNFSDSMGITEAQCTSKTSDMLLALTKDDQDAALALMHPDATAGAKAGLEQIADFLDGRYVVELKQVSVQITTSSGSNGKVQREQASFKTLLADGSQMYVTVYHDTTDSGEGFVSFQVILGVA